MTLGLSPREYLAAVVSELRMEDAWSYSVPSAARVRTTAELLVVDKPIGTVLANKMTQQSMWQLSHRGDAHCLGLKL